jgi:hypothetical protein
MKASIAAEIHPALIQSSGVNDLTVSVHLTLCITEDVGGGWVVLSLAWPHAMDAQTDNLQIQVQ